MATKSSLLQQSTRYSSLSVISSHDVHCHGSQILPMDTFPFSKKFFFENNIIEIFKNLFLKSHLTDIIPSRSMKFLVSRSRGIERS